MVDLLHQAGGNADLVAVGRIAVRRGSDDLSLGQLALHGLIQRTPRICRAGDTHRGINIGTSRKRVSDCAADASGRAAERLDLRRVVVRFILEQKQPVFLLPVDGDFDFDGAGVDLFRLVETLHFPGSF